MKIEVGEHGIIEIREAYTGVVFVGDGKERFGVCMRDGGVEFNYAGKWYSAVGGKITPLNSVTTEIEHDENEDMKVTSVTVSKRLNM